MGKTINTVYERFYGANGQILMLKLRNKNSALHGHISETGDPECEFVFKDVEILGTCSYDLGSVIWRVLCFKNLAKNSL